MSLLALQDVSKRFRDGTRWTVVLDGVSLQMDAGESVGVFASKRAGKTTLLEIAAGIEAPDSGVVSWEGQDLAGLSASGRAQLLRIGGVVKVDGAGRARDAASVLEYVASPLYSVNLTMRDAERRALQALRDVQAHDLRDRPVSRLSLDELVRVDLAHALVREPRLLLVDEPAVIPQAEEARELYALLHELHQRFGFAMLIASAEVTPLRGLKRILNLSNGQLYSTDSRRKVVHLSDRRMAGGGSEAEAS